MRHDMREAVDQSTIWDVLQPLTPEPAPTYPDRLLVLPCGRTKAPGGGTMPAIDRYQGSLWQTLRTHDPRGELAQVAFLSAYYGGPWCARETGIADYDRELTPEQAKLWIATGRTHARPYASAKTEDAKRRDGGVGLYGMIRRAAPHRQIREVCLVGSRLYLDVMHTQLRRQMGPALSQSVAWTEINGTPGRMRQAVRIWLTAPLSALAN